jgi:hypothetical protein
MPCPLCFGTAVEGLALSSGAIVHRHCYDELDRVISTTEQYIIQARSKVDTLRRQIKWNQSILGQIVGFWIAKHFERSSEIFGMFK